jgi:hypothetical protein
MALLHLDFESSHPCNFGRYLSCLNCLVWLECRVPRIP